jgi:hypothetical protein
MDRSATNRPRPRSSCPHWQRGRLAIQASYAARASIEAVNALTFEVDLSVEAGQSVLSRFREASSCLTIWARDSPLSVSLIGKKTFVARL